MSKPSTRKPSPAKVPPMVEIVENLTGTVERLAGRVRSLEGRPAETPRRPEGPGRAQLRVVATTAYARVVEAIDRATERKLEESATLMYGELDALPDTEEFREQRLAIWRARFARSEAIERAGAVARAEARREARSIMRGGPS